MEGLEKKYSNFNNCYAALGRALVMQKELQKLADDNPIVNDLLSAGVIQHFEIAYETAWKFLKEYLFCTKEIEVSSPREVFRSCFRYQIITEKVFNELIQLADARNKTTHMYNRVLAKEVYDDITGHYKVLGEILKTITVPDIS